VSEKKMINNKKLANGVNDNEQSKKVSWWINELDSLGIEKNSSSNDNEVIALFPFLFIHF
jgi:hypothetical protein